MDLIPQINLSNPARRFYITSSGINTGIGITGTSDNFSVQLSGGTIIFPTAHRLYFGVLKATIPNTWYNISTTTNTFVVTYESNDVGPTPITIVVPLGNWGAQSLFDYLATRLTEEIRVLQDGIALTPFVGSIKSYFNINTGRGEFFYDGIFTDATVLLEVDTDDFTIGEKIGFLSTQTSNLTITIDGANSLLQSNRAIAATIPQLAGPLSYQIRSDTFKSNVWTIQEQNYSTILASIPVTNESFATTLYSTESPELNELVSVTNTLNFRITDERGRRIDFNGFDVDIVLGVYAHRE